MQKLPYLLLGLGFFTLAVASVGWFILPNISSDGQTSASKTDFIAEIEEGKKETLWDFAKEIKVETLLKITLFHVTNPGKVLEGKKPKFTEAGPYIYEETRTRTTISVDDSKDRIIYKDHVNYHFRPDLSQGSEDDIVTIINLPYVGLAQQMAAMSIFSRIIVLGIVSRYNESIFMTKSIKELLFGGFYHELIAIFSSITGETYMPNNTFGFFYDRNNTFQETREISSDLSSFGSTLKWNNLTEMKWWGKDSICNKFKGSDWNLEIHPGLSLIPSSNSTLNIFMADMCRNLRFQFQSTTSFNGIPGHRFTLPQSEFQDPKVNHDNICYCTQPGTDEANCPKDGMYQINACSKGASILLSFPHFLHADPEYLKQTEGLNPNPELHETFIDIEPVSGQTLRSSKRVQVNLHLRPLKLSISEFKKVPDMIFPVMWTEDTSQLKEQFEDEIRLQIGLDSRLESLIKLVSVAGFSAGMILITASIIIFLMRLRKKDYPV